MKHLLKIEKFIDNVLNEEALPLNLAKYYVELGGERNFNLVDRLNTIMGNKQRLYLSVVEPEKISSTQKQVETYLNTLGYTIVDYKGNMAQNIEGDKKRQMRIAKLLQRNNPELLSIFIKDPEREMSKNIGTKSIVISQHPYDVAGMSAGTGREAWHSSCLNAVGGGNKHYLPGEIQNGTLCAYYINSDDTNIEKPLGRVNIKPYCDTDEYEDSEDVAIDDYRWFPDKRVYGNFPPSALKILKEWIISWQGVQRGQFIKIDGCYNYEGTAYKIEVYSNLKIEEICHEECDGDGDGFDEWGYDEDGFDRDGYSEDGYDRDGYNREGYDEEGYNHDDQNFLGYDRNFKIKYIKNHKDDISSYLDRIIKGEYTIGEDGGVDILGDIVCNRSRDIFGNYDEYWNHSIIPFRIDSLKGNVILGEDIHLGGFYNFPEVIDGSVRLGKLSKFHSDKVKSITGSLHIGTLYTYNNDRTKAMDLKIGGDLTINRSYFETLDGFPKYVGGVVDIRGNTNSVFYDEDVLDYMKVSQYSVFGKNVLTDGGSLDSKDGYNLLSKKERDLLDHILKDKQNEGLEYKIDEDGVIFKGNVFLDFTTIDKYTYSQELPLRMKKVDGNLNITKFQLIKSFVNFPQEITGDLHVSSPNHPAYPGDGIDMSQFPQRVGGDINISHGSLVTLSGLPKKVNGNLTILSKNLKFIIELPELITGDFWVDISGLFRGVVPKTEILGDFIFSGGWPDFFDRNRHIEVLDPVTKEMVGLTKEWFVNNLKKSGVNVKGSFK
jgi:hypothetical protein